MAFIKSLGLLGLLGLATGAAVPTNDGFPMPNKDQQVALAKQAGGKLPNVALPKELGPGSTTAFQLIAFNELFETAYFGSLLQNITDGVQGYEADNKQELMHIFSTVRAVRVSYFVYFLKIGTDRFQCSKRRSMPLPPRSKNC